MSAWQIGPAEIDAILDLRWRVLHPDRPRRAARMTPDRAPTTRHWALCVDGEVVACVSVLALRGWALRGLAVDPAHRRRGLGAALVRHVTREVAAPLWCNARLDAVPFYRAVGWTEVGPIFEIAGEGAHQRMVWGGA